MEFFLNLLNLTIPTVEPKENHVIILLRVALQSIWETRSLKLSTVNSELKLKTCLMLCQTSTRLWFKVPVGEWMVCLARLPRQEDRKSLRWALYRLGTLAFPVLALAGVADPLDGGVSPSEK